MRGKEGAFALLGRLPGRRDAALASLEGINSRRRCAGSTSAFAAMRYVGSPCLLGGLAMRTGMSEPRDGASWTFAVSVRQANIDHGTWLSRRGNPHAYPPNCSTIRQSVLQLKPRLNWLICAQAGGIARSRLRSTEASASTAGLILWSGRRPNRPAGPAARLALDTAATARRC